MKTKVQDFAEVCAADLIGVYYEELAGATVDPDNHDGGELAGIDIIAIMALIEMIMTMIQELLENCPANDEQVRESMKAPSIWQRVRFKSLVRAQCESCRYSRWRRESGEIAASMIRNAAATDNATLDAIVDQVRNSDDNWLL